ncbi:ImcF-related family protein [Klebsiella variicola]|uniref:ImcF-related family protein n=1 Tax=Klebsiella variicola TaxID=244366 RepID=UPI0027DED57E|nr:ImcF-related family protein [Klebsiella variicola]MDQ5752004.1 ImcF-related family protein [Klebsiella variicola subsp. variicola]
MNIPGNGLGRFGLAGLTLAGMAAIWWGITRYGGMLNINTRGEQVLAFVLVCLALVFVFYLPAMSRRVKESLYRRQSQQASVLPGEEGRVALTPPHHITVGEIRQTLRYQYGRAWSRKVRILLIIGSVRDVEQLTPKLTQELWQEDQGTLLLWGGDPGAAVDNAWFTALRKLRYRPADGMVWVTSGFDGVLTTMNRTKPRLTPDEMDSVSHSLKLRYEALGWKLPLYVWSLYEGGNEKNGRITQPVGCLLPAGSTPQIVAEQFTALAPLLIEQGIQQICGQPQHNFLLTLADQLTRKPETVTEPLSVLLNPYRPQPLAVRLHALSALQKTLSQLEYRSQHGAPWYFRAGLSQNDDLLAALFPRYGERAQPLLRDAVARHLEEQLTTFVQLPPDSPLREKMTKTAYDQLKLYLMLARPEKMDAAWFATTLMQDWPQRSGIADAVWQGSGPSLLAFYAANLASHPQWRLPVDDGLVSQARTRLIRQLGQRNSESTLYQKMLAQVANQYADMRLADMTADTDASRLFSTDEVVPGMFTRQAWEQTVQPAIEKVVVERRDEMDWVLSDTKQPAAQSASPEALRARLAERYFADFSGAWLDFLNSFRWQRAATLSDAIDQLTLMADVRQSPLVALMNTLSVQGRTGQTGEAIADSLVKSAKQLFNRDNPPAIDQQSGARGPLDATFGPVLALLDNRDGGTPTSRLSLQTFLTRVTQVRLRLQQVTNATDPQAMTRLLAQTVFQGKAVDLTETRDYGSLVAAGLGQEWSGFGQTLFVHPMEQAWQQVLTPAAESLNAQWRSAVVEDWNSAFGGRYPFKNTSSEVSLPLLAKYLNSETGRIARFLQTRLNGVLHKEGSRWMADSINAQGLTFNPAFLQAMNTLSHLSDVAFANGEAGLHFALRPGTADGVMQTELVIDSQKLVYMNQMPAWRRFSWPADTEAPGASLSWISTRAGTRQYGDFPGAWGWIRLLDKAVVSAYPGTSSSWSLSWKAPDGLLLNYTLRTEAGEGPLALLALRNFTLPETIFSVRAPAERVPLTDDIPGEEGY